MKTPLPLPRICIAATGGTASELLAHARAALRHSRFVELRLDWAPNPAEALAGIPALLRTPNGGRKRDPILLATCRREANGGRFRGTVSEQMAILEKAASAGCRLLDLEIESAEAVGLERVSALRKAAPLLLSFHDFHKMPRLESVAIRLRRFPADYYKLVGTATRQSDNCAILDFLGSANEKAEETERTEGGKWIAFCMGEAGIPSRVLALARGSSFVYAASPATPERTEQTEETGSTGYALPEPSAPGQLDWDTLRKRYRADALTRQSALYGVLGSPVRHSLGAAIHNAAFQSRRMDAVYLPLLAADLRDFREAAERYPLAGFSVTIPHKESILEWVDRSDRNVQAAGAANTIRIRRAKWEAINTDVEGIVRPLRRALRLGERASLRAGFRTVILGNGGAARAAILALQQLRCQEIFLSGRHLAKVRHLATEMGCHVIPLPALESERFDLLVQATPVGMWPHTEECLLRPEQIHAGIVFDLVYNPPETRLLQLARERGSRSLSGLEMFLAQAARQFEYWTGVEAPLRVMRETALQELARMRKGT